MYLEFPDRNLLEVMLIQRFFLCSFQTQKVLYESSPLVLLVKLCDFSKETPENTGQTCSIFPFRMFYIVNHLSIMTQKSSVLHELIKSSFISLDVLEPNVCCFALNVFQVVHPLPTTLHFSG